MHGHVSYWLNIIERIKSNERSIKLGCEVLYVTRSWKIDHYVGKRIGFSFTD